MTTSDTQTIRWRLCLTEKEEGVVLEAARRVRPPSNKSPQYVRPKRVSDDLSRFLLLQKTGSGVASEEDETLVAPNAVSSKEDLLEVLDEHGTGTPVENRERDPTRFADGTMLPEPETFFVDVEMESRNTEP